MRDAFVPQNLLTISLAYITKKLLKSVVVRLLQSVVVVVRVCPLEFDVVFDWGERQYKSSIKFYLWWFLFDTIGDFLKGCYNKGWVKKRENNFQQWRLNEEEYVITNIEWVRRRSNIVNKKKDNVVYIQDFAVSVYVKHYIWKKKI